MPKFSLKDSRGINKALEKIARTLAKYLRKITTKKKQQYPHVKINSLEARLAMNQRTNCFRSILNVLHWFLLSSEIIFCFRWRTKFDKTASKVVVFFLALPLGVQSPVGRTAKFKCDISSWKSKSDLSSVLHKISFISIRYYLRKYLTLYFIHREGAKIRYYYLISILSWRIKNRRLIYFSFSTILFRWVISLKFFLPHSQFTKKFDLCNEIKFNVSLQVHNNNFSQAVRDPC